MPLFSRKHRRDGEHDQIAAEQERTARQLEDARRDRAVQEAKAADERQTTRDQRAALAADGFADIVRQSLLNGHHRGREAPS